MENHRNGLIILANNTKWMDGMDKFWPYRDGQEPFRMLLIAENRAFPDKDREMIEWKAQAQHKIFRDALVIRASAITQYYSHQLDLGGWGRVFLELYTMGMNILGHHFALTHLGYNKVLFLDDDIFVVRKLDKIFEEDCHVHHRDGLSPFTLAEETPRALVRDILVKDIFKLPFDTENLNKLKVQGGHRLWVKSEYLDNYTQFLNEFFNNPKLLHGWLMRNKKVKGYMVPFWLIDQHFEAMFVRWMMMQDPDFVKFDILAKIEYGRTWGKYTRRPSSWMVHYANGVNKEKFYDDFSKAAETWKDWDAVRDLPADKAVEDKLPKWGWK